MNGLGDGPITDPYQDPVTGEIQMPDDYVGSGSQFNPNQQTTVATVGPTIVPATPAPTNSITADVADSWNSFVNWITGGSSPSSTPTTTPSVATDASGGSSSSTLLWVGAALVAGYYLFKKKTPTKRSTKRS